MILFANRILGVPRIRQLRVKNDSCKIPTVFQESITVCYDHYSPEIEDESEFGPNPGRKYTEADAWRYQGSEIYQSIILSFESVGLFNTNPSG
jgi:polycystin 2